MNTKKEIESFNLADLDIQALELRLEMAGVVQPDGWGGSGGCDSNCGSFCSGNCNYNCGVLGCWVDNCQTFFMNWS